MDGSKVGCYDDSFHNYSKPAMLWFEEHFRVKAAFMIISALACDFAILATIYIWTF